MKTERLTRTQVEERLRDQESKIAGRIESIESSVPVRSLARIGKIGSGKHIKLVAFIGAGTVVGIFIALRKKTRKPVGLDEGMSRLSSRIADSIRDELDSGEDPDEAVRKALGRTPPILQLQETERSLFGEAVRQFSRLLTRELALSGSKTLLRTLGIMEEKSDDDEAGSDGPEPSGRRRRR